MTGEPARSPDQDPTERAYLSEVRLTGLGVIDEAVLDLSEQLTVITGETGAGKTMLLTGLGLLLGERADAAVVRPGAVAAVAEGRLVHPPEPVCTVVDQAGGVIEDGELLLARQVSDQGRSRAHVGGRAVPVNVLGEIARHVVAVHGQADQQRLRSPGAQRDALDRYAAAAVTTPLTAYRDKYRRWRAVGAELAEAAARADEQAQTSASLQAALADIQRLAPTSGEDVALRVEVERLSHAASLREAAEAAHAALVGDAASDVATPSVDATSVLAAAAHALDRASAHDPLLGQLARRVDEARYLITDVAGELASHAMSLDIDPDRLAALQERRAALAALVRKYAALAQAEQAAGDDADTASSSPLDEVLAWANRAAEQVADLQAAAERVDTLRQEQDQLRTELAQLAAQVSRARQEAADRLAEAVAAELAALAMPGARLSVEVRQVADPEGLLVDGRSVAFGPDGVDEVTFLLAAHPGAPARPLGRAASGGELSRMMLAVEVVLAGVDPVPVFVFDEVDAGVGGRAAQEVGRRLARLARTAQVLVVTHLPQVAAFADRHLVVTKSTDGSVTSSGVRAVDGPDRVRELARMLAGVDSSEAATTHARELLDLAGADTGPAAGRTRRATRQRAVAPPH